jgi:4-hydroxy-3-methylbut-2-enyl diphosphate reductase
MVVIGGKNSANTTHLADISRQECPNTHHIETPQELERSWFEGAQRIGITAGASTPAAQIEAVRQKKDEQIDQFLATNSKLIEEIQRRGERVDRLIDKLMEDK